MKCGCGNDLMTGDFEGICTRCRNAINQAKQWPQNLPKADAYSLLAEVREFLHKESMLPESYCVDEVVISVEKLDKFLFNYISEHFS